VTTSSLANSGRTAAAGRVVRHALPDRLFHWVGAVCVLTLLGTAFLPIAGLRFGWVTAHWIAGVALIAAVLFHVVRVLVRGTLGSMWVGRADIADALEIASATLARKLPARRPGKYSVAQKLIHHAFAVVVLATLVTGGLMLARIDSPWWQRNPYLLADDTWGIVYVVHGLAALLLITMVMMHVYFALRSEKLKYTRAMIRGWITRREFDEHHDPTRWQVDP
jgi:cytochrome b subunit of formate dehydrogenase